MQLFRKLIVDNNWGHKTFFYNSVQLTPQSKIDSLSIKCPDGTVINNAQILWQQESTTVLDHGKPYTTTSDIPYIEMLINGVQIKIPLTKFKVKIEMH